MSYSVDLRERVVSFVRGGGSPTKAAQVFQVGRTTLYRWLNSADLQPKPSREGQRKLNKAALAEHVRNFPDALLRERAAHFGVHINAIWTALKKLKITKKTTRYAESHYEERITFLRALRNWIAKHGKANVVYFDESGFAKHTHRPHGWALRGRRVFGIIKGRNRKRTNLIMALRGADSLAPMLFEASCTHLTVTSWVKEMLLPALRPNSLVIMDNARSTTNPKSRSCWRQRVIPCCRCLVTRLTSIRLSRRSPS